MACLDLGYEVVEDTITLLSSGGVQEFRIPVPTGKVPFSGGYKSTPVRIDASYPDGDEWMFEFVNGSGSPQDVDVYVVAMAV